MRRTMPRRWELVIDLDRTGALPPFLQIARALTEDIRRGRLRPGERLPGSRRLATTVRVHRNTVLAALAELQAEGWIETTPGRGTFVSRAIPDERGTPASRRLAPRTQVPARAAFPLADPPIAYRPPVLPRGTLNLSNGAPDVRLVPARAIGRAYRRVLAQRSSGLLAYGEPEGHPALRSALASMLASTRGLAITGDDVLVTRGSQMALTLVARALVRAGDIVAVENVGYRPAWEAFRAAGATVVPVAVDRDGIDVGALKGLVSRTALRAIYLTPHHQYPTTVTLKAARRIALLSLAQSERIAIIEDDYDHEFHYEGRPTLPLASADRAGLVVYIGTLSKVLAPGLRVGYVVAPPAVLRSLGAIRSLLDIQGDLATEAALATLIEDGEVQRHMEFTLAAGGMALWVRVRLPVDVDAWSRRGLDYGVSWYTGRRYAFDGQPRPFARFTFAWLNERELPEAVKRMAAARPRA
jgi:GntR family transcriptional regulator/MocR family aminotransferase